jgi:hypothetical protein
VQIAFDPAARLVCGRDDPSTRSGELRPAPFEFGCSLGHLHLEVVPGPANFFFCASPRVDEACILKRGSSMICGKGEQ